MKSTIIKILKIGVPIALGLYLTWYFFNGMSPEELQETKNAFFEANYFWVILGLVLAVLSHWSRAYRWLFVLEPMGYSPSKMNSFHTVMSGYVINYTIPRSGEVARAGLMAGAEGVPFEKGFATIVVERVIDMMMFGVIFIVSGFLQADAEGLKKISAGSGGNSSLLWYILGGAAVLGLVGLILYLRIPKIKNFVNEKLKGFGEGLKTIWTMKKKWAYLGHTVFIWACYVGMIAVSAQAFPETKNMPIGCVFAAFVVGAAAIGAAPGGLGFYPLWVTGALQLYSIDFKAFGMFVWVVQTGLIVVLGLISLFIIQRKIKFVKEEKA